MINKRGRIFTRLIREITVAAGCCGGDDVSTNPCLRLAVDKALAANMTRDTIDRAVKRGSGESDDTHYEEMRYEGYGPAGTAIMVDCLSDNRKHTVSEVRHAFTRARGNLGTDGSVAYLFNRAGVLGYAAGNDEDAIIELALESGAEDVNTVADGSVEVTTSSENFMAVKDAMSTTGLVSEQAEIIERPATLIDVDLEKADHIMQLIDVLEEPEDVQQVHTNADFSDEVMMQLSAPISETR